MPNWWSGPWRHCPELFACTLFLNTDVSSHFEEKAFWFPITREEIINPSISKVSRALFWLVVQSVNIAEVRHSTRVTHLCGSPSCSGLSMISALVTYNWYRTVFNCTQIRQKHNWEINQIKNMHFFILPRIIIYMDFSNLLDFKYMFYRHCLFLDFNKFSNLKK